MAKVLAKIRARVWGCNREGKEGEVNRRKRVMTDGDIMRGRRWRWKAESTSVKEAYERSAAIYLFCDCNVFFYACVLI